MKRKALVSGAGRNIGRAIALRLARAGCDVAVNVRSNRAEGEDTAKEVRALGVEAVVCVGDVGVRGDVPKIADTALKAFGNIDILVNTASARPFKAFLEMSYEDWQTVMDVSATGVFHMTKMFLPAMVERRWGRIINFTGMNSIRGYADRVHIAAAKHAVWGLTKALSREVGPHNVTVNAISPGPTESEHTGAPGFDDLIRAQVKEIPLGRLGKKEEIAALAAFLASDEGGFVTGQMLGINGGAET